MFNYVILHLCGFGLLHPVSIVFQQAARTAADQGLVNEALRQYSAVGQGGITNPSTGIAFCDDISGFFATHRVVIEEAYVQLIVGTLGAHPGCVPLQSSGCRAIRELCRVSPNIPLAVAAGAVDRIQHAWAVLERAQDVPGKLHAVSAIAALTSTDTVSRIIDGGWVQRGLGFMEGYPGSRDVQLVCCQVLYQIAVSCRAGKAAVLADERSVAYLERTRDRFRSDHKVQKYCTLALGTLVGRRGCLASTTVVVGLLCVVFLLIVALLLPADLRRSPSDQRVDTTEWSYDSFAARFELFPRILIAALYSGSDTIALPEDASALQDPAFVGIEGLNHVLSVMDENRLDADKQWSSCRTLAALARHRGGKAAILTDYRTISSIRWALDSYHDHARVQQFCQFALGTLANTSSAAAECERIGRQPVLSLADANALVTIGTLSLNDTNVCAAFCHAVATLSELEGNQITLGVAAVTAVLEVMKVHPTDLNVQSDGCRALLNINNGHFSPLARTNFRAQTVAAGAVEVVSQAWETLAGSSPMLEHDVRDQERAVAVITVLTTAQSVHAILDAGWLGRVLVFMDEHQGNPEAQWVSSQALAGLAQHPVGRGAILADSRSLQYLQRAFEAHPSDEDVQRHSRLAVKTLVFGGPL